MALSQRLQQKLSQKLSPQQIQLMKLLQVPTAYLDERVKEEIEENPALEEASDNFDNNDSDSDEFQSDSSADGDVEMDGSEEDYENIDISDYVSEGDDDVADYKYHDGNYGQEETKTIPHKVETTFYDSLKNQLLMLDLDPRQRKIAEQIVGSIDDDGYLRRASASIADDLAFRQNIMSDEKEIEKLIKMIQQFDPPGVCARDLQECLLIQLRRKRDDGAEVDAALNVIRNHFDDFTKKHYGKIQKTLDLDRKGIKSVIDQIITLNPKPGGESGDSSTRGQSYVVPDFFVMNIEGQLEVTLNSKNAPDLRISAEYRDMLKDYDKGDKKDKRQKETVLFIKQKIDSAKWFIDAIKQRQHTLLSTMRTIVDYQRQFFLSGEDTDLRPMILKDIAERTGLDISTVSRVANSKYVQTEFGTYRLKYFFSESLVTDTGEVVSTREVKKVLSDIIEEENKKKPLSDEKLTSALQKKGYNIARRTVAKYREQLNIPVARLRKEI